ncbi:hypothetical protein LLEC1_07228 [Akanthomyces lecanii]|uniref:Uncharacterized protein n=1 Tax=Cordyceps confragosa TaxID=2714763 RepID=A0A179IUC4_CORDF|nr:hypothetical protein LLEC1_07228 [Akanthomyces lecanii]
MKFALLSLPAAVSAVAPREPPPLNSNPVQTGGETTPTQSLTILPIVSVTDLPTTTSSDKVTLPILTSPFTHSTHTLPPSTPAPTSLPTNSNGSTYSSPYNSTTSAITTHESTTSSETVPTESSTSASGNSGSQASGSQTSGSQTTVATANVLAGIAAIAGLVMAA